jgi:hypothetical protein
MRDFWNAAHSFGGEGGTPGRQLVVAFPQWREAEDATTFKEVVEHIDSCADICEFLGESLLVAGRHPTSPPTADEPQPPRVPLILLRSFRQEPWGDYSDENFGEDDPFADMPDGLYDEEVVEVEQLTDETCVSRTMEWVSAVSADMGLAPSDDAPVLDPYLAGVSYPITHARTGEEMYASFWAAACELGRTDARTHACTLLIAPNFSRYNANGFEFLAYTLNEVLPAPLNLGEDVQLVFYHPQHTLTDEDRERRVTVALGTAPLPSICLLRTAQVAQTRQRLQVGSHYTRALIEVHERVCGPEGGLIW